jgi:hypothetical protein
MKVCVDTNPPRVNMQALAHRERGFVILDYTVEDENLDLSTLRLEYRVAGRGDAWQPVVRELLLRRGEFEWKLPPQPPDVPLEVRLQARDKAGNTGEGLMEIKSPYSESK